jgi:hypothetical protein
MSGQDFATVRAVNRAAVVACAMSYLGPERERDCDILGDCAVHNIDMICAATAFVFVPSPDLPEHERIRLIEQVRQHNENLANTAYRALADLFRQTLVVALRGAEGRESDR